MHTHIQTNIHKQTHLDFTSKNERLTLRPVKLTCAQVLLFVLLEILNKLNKEHHALSSHSAGGVLMVSDG